MMYLVRKRLRKQQGVVFFKPLGTGGGAGYSIWPDFSVYGLLVVWESEQQAEAYLESALYKDYTAHSCEQYTLFLAPVRSKGSWSGFSDWRMETDEQPEQLVAALTRATLKARFVIPFWKMTPGVSREHENFAGLLFSKGVGEIPLLEQATFTVWEKQTDLESFAFRNFHAEAIRRTREKNGFSEQMFTRFRPLKAVGSWNGQNRVQEILNKQRSTQS